MTWRTKFECTKCGRNAEVESDDPENPPLPEGWEELPTPRTDGILDGVFCPVCTSSEKDS